MFRRVQHDYSQNASIGQQRLLAAFEQLLGGLEGCFADRRTFERAKMLAKGLICSDAPHRITNWLIAVGKEFEDWTASYRFFSRAVWEAREVFDVVLREVGEVVKGCADFFACIDEVHVPKSGKKIPGARVLHDPLALPFVRGLHRALRFINCCGLVPDEGYGCSSARAVCLGFEFAPPAAKPRKTAPEEEWARYKKAAKEQSICRRAAGVARDLRQSMDRQDSLREKRLVAAVDGGLTNKAMFGELPDRTVLVGRVRKDARFYRPPEAYSGVGRRRKYGERLATPEEIRKDKATPWRKRDVWAAGRRHWVRYKSVGPVLWRSGSKDRAVRLIVVEPLRYRPRKGAKMLYREPAYLVVSDADYDEKAALQCYFHRVQVEVNHRDAKSIIGAGDAQVWSEKSVYRQPQFAMAVLSMLTLASYKAYGPGRTGDYGPLARWRNDKRMRPSTGDMVGQLWRELIQAGIMSFWGFVCAAPLQRTIENPYRPIVQIGPSALADAQPLPTNTS